MPMLRLLLFSFIFLCESLVFNNYSYVYHIFSLQKEIKLNFLLKQYCTGRGFGISVRIYTECDPICIRI